jgi:hypothetical protein
MDGRATTITYAKICRLESIGMVWDAQKGGNCKRKNFEDKDDNFIVSGRRIKYSVSVDQNENTPGTIKKSALKMSSGQLRDQEIQEGRKDALKIADIMDVEELVNNRFTPPGSAVKKASKKHVRDDGNYATLINLTSVQNKNASSRSMTKYGTLLYPRTAVKEPLHKTSRIVNAQRIKSKTMEYSAGKHSHSRNGCVRKLQGTECYQCNGFLCLHQSKSPGLVFNNGDTTSESGNCRPNLLLGLPLKGAKRNDDNIKIDSLPVMTEVQQGNTNLSYIETEQSTSEIIQASSSGCEPITNKPSEWFLIEALKAGWELTTHMPAESIEEVYFFLETMKWRNIMNFMMSIQP